MKHQHAYEYGQRWAARLPRNDLRVLISHIHCTETEERVCAEVDIQIDKASWSNRDKARLRAQCHRYALCVFREHVRLYHYVVRGGWY